MAVFEGTGGHFVDGDRFCQVGTEQTKIRPEKNLKNVDIFVFRCGSSLFSSKTKRFWPLVPPIGAVRTEKAVFRPPAGEHKIPARPTSVLDMVGTGYGRDRVW